MAIARDMLSMLLDRQRPDWSLEQAFYIDDDLYEFERREWLSRQWVLIAHVSELAATGSRIVRDLLGESILVVRAGTDDVRAYFNVCTHRGSRLCKSDGRARLLVCPYHAWSFKLTGEIQSARDLPGDADPAELGLRAVRVHVAEGLIFCALGAEDLPDPSIALDALRPCMRQHGFASARIAARKVYPTNANWKLVVENAFECYHCRNAHPEYSRVNAHVQVTGTTEDAGARSWEAEVARWTGTLEGAAAHNQPVCDVGSLNRMPYRVARQPIGGGRETLSADGRPVAPLMGGFRDYDGGETQFRFGRLSFASAANDYITLVQIMPRGPCQTDMVLTWLVDADAPPALDIEKIQWMWDVTTFQDKLLVEDNALGVRSQAYRPGPYTALETSTAAFVSTYLSEMREIVAGTR